VARLVPVGEKKGKRQPGSLKGGFSISPEFFEPLPDDEVSAWEYVQRWCFLTRTRCSGG
jgi:antitoxin (DNA-binding transcriptional repressor) of toxin-antitoxin stability system